MKQQPVIVNKIRLFNTRFKNQTQNDSNIENPILNKSKTSTDLKLKQI